MSGPAEPLNPALGGRRGIPRIQETGLLIVIFALSLFLWLASGNVTHKVENPAADGGAPTVRYFQENGFLRTNNLVNSVLVFMTYMAVMAIGQTIVIISGGIDISVGSVLGLSAFVTALVLKNFGFEGSPWIVVPVGILLPLGIGLACGLLNGSLIVGLRMHPFIVTLATLSIFRWASLKLGMTYGQSQPGNLKLPAAFTDNFISLPLKNSRFGGGLIESYTLIPILITLGCLAAGWIYLRHTVWGRETYAIGGNEEAARYSGIKIKWAKMRVYAICGLCAGIGGMLTCGMFKAAQTSTGEGYELNVVAAAVVGGASLTGGRGTALGAVLGMLVLQLIDNGIFVLGELNLGFMKIPVVREDNKLILGCSIILAVLIDQISTNIQSRRSARLRTAAH